MGHKGAIVPHPGACVSPILFKRHVPDALAKVGEDMGDLHREGDQEGEDLWALPPPSTDRILPPSQVGALGAGDTAVRKATRRPCPDGADHLVGDPDTEDRWGREQRDFHRGEGLQSEKAKAQ